MGAVFDGAVLIGGASRRMGVAKAGIVVDGTMLADRVATALEDAGAERVVFVGSSVAMPLSAGRFQVVDRWPGHGPLGGIVTAIGATTAPLVAVLACDLPDATGHEVQALVSAIGRADVAVSTLDGVDQPLHAVWSRRAVDPLALAFAEGERSIRGVLGDLDVVRVSARDPEALADVDTPEILRARQRRR